MKMDSKNQSPPSVIETLMGLNVQPVQKRQRQRVLSENYLQKASSLHFSLKSLRSRTCSSTMQVDVTDLVPTVRHMDQFCNADYQIWSDSLFTSSLQDLQDTSLYPHHSRIMKPPNPPKFENSPETKISRDAIKYQQKRKHIPFKPSKGRFSIKKYQGPEQDFALEIVDNRLDASTSKISESSISFLSGNRIRKDGNLCGPGPGPAKVNWIMTHKSLSRPRAHWDTNWYLISEEANRSTPSVTRLHITECKGSSIPCNFEPIFTNLGSSPSMMSENEIVKVSPSNKSKIRRCDQNASEGSNGVYELLESSSCLDFSRPNACEMGLASQTQETQNDDTSGSDATQIERLICDADDICREASHSLSENTLVSCQTPEPLSPTSSEEISRRSPISVLESLSEEAVTSTMDCLMNGSTDLYEVYSEGLGMTVSSDEDNREESVDIIEDSAALSDNSYLVSVLSEACGLDDVNFNIWPLFENPITPLVFQILEVKYGRHVSWPRSERKLLFDRINLGLMDIAKSCFGIRQISASVRLRFSACWTQKEIEENLSRLLVIQDKEATKTNDIRPVKGKNATAKKGKKSNAITCKSIKASADDFSFLKLEDYMDEVIIDIERSLLAELVSECVNAVLKR